MNRSGSDIDGRLWEAADEPRANSASDARGSELDIRRKHIEARVVDIMVAVGSSFFYTVTLPCTFWFFDKGKSGNAAPPCGSVSSKTQGNRATSAALGCGAPRKDTVLYIDARQIDQAHRDWTPAQIEYLATIARLYRDETMEDLHDSAAMTAESYPDGVYTDIPGLRKVAAIAEIEAQGWSLNPGRCVGVAARDEDDFDFKYRLEELNEELETLNVEARELEARIAENVAELLEEA